MKSLTPTPTTPHSRRNALPLMLTVTLFFTPITATIASEGNLQKIPHSIPPQVLQDAHFLLAAWDKNDKSRGDERPDSRDGDRDNRDHDRDRRDGGDGRQNMDMLDRLLSMSSEQLSQIRQAVERIEKMTPQEREALRERLRSFRDISPEQRQHMREKWRELSHEERREFIQRMHEHRWNQVFEEGESPGSEAAPDVPSIPGATHDSKETGNDEDDLPLTEVPAPAAQ